MGVEGNRCHQLSGTALRPRSSSGPPPFGCHLAWTVSHPAGFRLSLVIGTWGLSVAWPRPRSHARRQSPGWAFTPPRPKARLSGHTVPHGPVLELGQVSGAEVSSRRAPGRGNSGHGWASGPGEPQLAPVLPEGGRTVPTHNGWPAIETGVQRTVASTTTRGPLAGGRVHLPSPLGPPTPAALSTWRPFMSRAAGL